MTAPTSGVGASAPRLRSFVGGTWADSAGEAWITDSNPSDANDIVAYVPEGAAPDAGVRGVVRVVSGHADILANPLPRMGS